METWTPTRAVQIVAGTPPGGGLDRVARALAASIEAARLLDVPVEVLNVPGDGARRVWTHHVDNCAGNGHVISISSPNLTSDYLVGIANFEHTRYSPIATLVTEYIAFGVRADSAFRNGADLLAALGGDPSSVRVALSTALGNPNHVALAQLTRHAGGDVNGPVVRVFNTALDAVADVVAGHADVCAVTAASVLAELNAGRMRLLGVSSPARLTGVFSDTPTWTEHGADCVVGAWRGVTGPTGLSQAQIAYWEDVLRGTVASPVWQAELSRMSWSPDFLYGAELRSRLHSEREDLVRILGELALLRGR